MNFSNIFITMIYFLVSSLFEIKCLDNLANNILLTESASNLNKIHILSNDKLEVNFEDPDLNLIEKITKKKHKKHMTHKKTVIDKDILKVTKEIEANIHECNYDVNVIPLLQKFNFKSKTPEDLEMKLHFTPSFMKIKMESEIEKEKGVKPHDKPKSAENKASDIKSKESETFYSDQIMETNEHILNFNSNIHYRNFYYFDKNVFWPLKDIEKKDFKDEAINKYVKQWIPYLHNVKASIGAEKYDRSIVTFRKKLMRAENVEYEMAYIIRMPEYSQVEKFGNDFLDHFRRYIIMSKDLLDYQLILPNQQVEITLFSERDFEISASKGSVFYEENGFILKESKKNCDKISTSSTSSHSSASMQSSTTTSSLTNQIDAAPFHSVGWDQLIDCAP
jgi:hypothetical protein